MSEVYAQVRAAGYADLYIADPSVLGAVTFPTGSAIYYQSNTQTSTAIAYYPGGADSPADTSNIAAYTSAEYAAGGIASEQPPGAGCNSSSASIAATKLETWMATKTGTPCVYPVGSVTYNGTTYASDLPNESWSNSTAVIAVVGSASLTPSSASSGYYTGNVVLRVAFVGTGANAVTYLACKQRYNDGSVRNCTKIGEGSYTITPLGDARVLSLNAPPAQVAALNYNMVWVERNGFVYRGYQSKPVTFSSARLNTTAAAALFTQLGMPPVDPEVPVALTPTSYQGTWDLRHAGDPVSATKGTTVYLYASGSAYCFDKSTNVSTQCTVTITDPATGAFTYSGTTGTASGRFDYLAGTVTGNYGDSTSNLMGGRR